MNHISLFRKINLILVLKERKDMTNYKYPHSLIRIISRLFQKYYDDFTHRLI